MEQNTQEDKSRQCDKESFGFPHLKCQVFAASDVSGDT